MTENEAIETIKCAKAEVEWNYPLDYNYADVLSVTVVGELKVATNVIDMNKIMFEHFRCEDCLLGYYDDKTEEYKCRFGISNETECEEQYEYDERM